MVEPVSLRGVLCLGRDERPSPQLQRVRLIATTLVQQPTVKSQLAGSQAESLMSALASWLPSMCRDSLGVCWPCCIVGCLWSGCESHVRAIYALGSQPRLLPFKGSGTQGLRVGGVCLSSPYCTVLAGSVFRRRSRSPPLAGAHWPKKKNERRNKKIKK